MLRRQGVAGGGQSVQIQHRVILALCPKRRSVEIQLRKLACQHALRKIDLHILLPLRKGTAHPLSDIHGIA